MITICAEHKLVGETISRYVTKHAWMQEFYQEDCVSRGCARPAGELTMLRDADICDEPPCASGPTRNGLFDKVERFDEVCMTAGNDSVIHETERIQLTL